MFEVQCSFSGVMVPKCRGIYKVYNDNKVVFTKGRRERTYIADKVAPRDIKWTETSRAFFKKTHNTTDKKTAFVPIQKIVRGFSFIPKAIIKDNDKVETKVSVKVGAGAKNQEKVAKNANMKSFRK
ncbi:hypothetical protein ENBRE01_2721 [Enteropsectra breve]|nr:hypothetical protein ENBRE01_2721 [Enteropsectra breve]